MEGGKEEEREGVYLLKEHTASMYAPEVGNSIHYVVRTLFSACIPNNAHTLYNLYIPHILSIMCTIAMAFLDCILTFGV